MRCRRVRFVLLVPAMIALAPLEAPWRIASAQIPEAPGTFTNPDGTI
jgi:hypothetical protein